MNSRLFLRIASIITFLHFLAHTVGGVFGTLDAAPARIAAAAMQANMFPMMGVTRSYWMFDRGLGLAVSVFLLADAVVFWILSSHLEGYERLVRPLLVVFLVAYLGFAAVSAIYFFPAAYLMESVISLCIAMAACKLDLKRIKHFR